MLILSSCRIWECRHCQALEIDQVWSVVLRHLALGNIMIQSNFHLVFVSQEQLPITHMVETVVSDTEARNKINLRYYTLFVEVHRYYACPCQKSKTLTWSTNTRESYFLSVSCCSTRYTGSFILYERYKETQVQKTNWIITISCVHTYREKEREGEKYVLCVYMGHRERDRNENCLGFMREAICWDRSIRSSYWN